MVLLFLICFLGYCFAISKFLKVPIELTPFIAVSLLISILYCSAWFHLLKGMAISLLFFGFGSFVFSPLYIKFYYKNIIVKYLTPGITTFIFFWLLLALLSIRVHVGGNDEFTHWAFIAKVIFRNDGFQTAADQVVLKAYPVGAALFYYLLALLNGSITDWTLYVAQQTLILSPLLTLMRGFSWGNISRAFLIFSLVLLLLCFFGLKIGLFGNLQMEYIVGIFFGMSLVFYVSSPRSMRQILMLAPIVFSLAMLKPGTIFLILLIVLIIIFDQIFFLKKIRGIFAGIILLLTGWGAMFSWQSYLHLINTPNNLYLNNNMLRKIYVFLPDLFSTNKGKIILIQFASHLTSIFIFLGVLSLLIVLVSCLMQDKKQRRENLLMHVLLFIGFFLYILGLLWINLYHFGLYEASRLASFNRYLKIYEVGWLLVVIWNVICITKEFYFQHYKTLERIGISLLSIFLIAVVMLKIHIDNNDVHKMSSVWFLRKSINSITQKVTQLTPDHSSIYIVWQGSRQFERNIILYNLLPRHFNYRCTSLGQRYGHNDHVTCSLSSEEVANVLKHYDYVLLGYTDKNFWRNYGTLFKKNKAIPIAMYSYCSKLKSNSEKCGLGCRLSQKKAYLFRIENKKRAISFKNIY
jgi:hypothetical protein